MATASDDVEVVFRTQSDVEAALVRGLLEAHGITVSVASDIPHSVFPLAINGLGEVRVSVAKADAKVAAQLIVDRQAIREEEDRARMGALDVLEDALDYRFTDRDLLVQALTHRSCANESVDGEIADNESLEFLGDAVLGLVISDRLFREFPEYDEGQKSKAKAWLVSSATLARRGVALGVGAHLLLGRGEEKTGGRQKPSLIADAFEAIVAAIYLDGGLSAARAFLDRQLGEAIEEIRQGPVAGSDAVDHKSALQEWLQAAGRPLPAYTLTSAHGPDHRKVFVVEVSVGSETVGAAEGRSKKDAEQKAARAALATLRSDA